MRLSNPIVLSVTLVLASSSFSTDASAFLGATSRACASAVKEFCGHVKPRVGPLRACFETHLDRLSGPCASRLSQAADVAKDCEADVKKLCGGVQRAAEVPDCMKPRLAEVSKRCKGALVKIAVPFTLFQ